MTRAYLSLMKRQAALTLKKTNAELKKIDASGSKFDPDESGRIKIAGGKDSRIRVIRDGREIPVNI